MDFKATFGCSYGSIFHSYSKSQLTSGNLGVLNDERLVSVSHIIAFVSLYALSKRVSFFPCVSSGIV